MLIVCCEELFIHLQVILIHGLLSRISMQVMTRVLDDWSAIVELLHEFLLEFIIILNIVIIMKLLMIIGVEIILIEILIVIL